jgi:hypothetical protein
MVLVVEADADELADAPDRRAEPRLALDLREIVRWLGREVRQRLRLQRLSRQVADRSGQVAQISVVVEETRLLRTDLAIAHEFHGVSPACCFSPRADRRRQRPRSAGSLAGW